MTRMYFSILLILIVINSVGQSLSLPLSWYFKSDNSAVYKFVTYNDKSWFAAYVLCGWAKLGLNKERVIALYRTSISLPENLQNRDIVFFAGMIDDADEAYLKRRTDSCNRNILDPKSIGVGHIKLVCYSEKIILKNNVIAI